VTAVRRRIGDRKVLALVKAFLGARVLRENGRLESPLTGTPQGGIISPLLANIYLSALDRHFERAWKNQTRYIGCSTYYRRKGHATYRLVRYADDFVILVRGSRQQAETVRDEVARLLRDELKMDLSLEKTLVTHVDEGFDFLGHHVRRVAWKGKRVGWTFPSKKSLASILRKVRSLTDRSTVYQSLRRILHAVNSVLRGWSNYFRYDASKRTLAYVDSFAWWRVFRWLRKKHPERTWKYLRKRYCGGRWTIQDEGVELFRPSKVKVERYRYRGTRILLPWMAPDELGEVGRYANSDYDDPSFLGSLQEALDVP
jgi:RNA-directed DNA polymerase